MALRSQKSIAVGTVLAGRFEVVSLLGQGGMGAAYSARDSAGNCDAVIKRPTHLDEASLAQFRKEYEILGRLDSPFIPKAYELVESERAPFIVMELVKGEPLSNLIEAGRLPYRSRNYRRRKVSWCRNWDKAGLRRY